MAPRHRDCNEDTALSDESNFPWRRVKGSGGPRIQPRGLDVVAAGAEPARCSGPVAAQEV